MSICTIGLTSNLVMVAEANECGGTLESSQTTYYPGTGVDVYQNNAETLAIRDAKRACNGDNNLGYWDLASECRANAMQSLLAGGGGCYSQNFQVIYLARCEVVGKPTCVRSKRNRWMDEDAQRKYTCNVNVVKDLDSSLSCLPRVLFPDSLSADGELIYGSSVPGGIPSGVFIHPNGQSFQTSGQPVQTGGGQSFQSSGQ